MNLDNEKVIINPHLEILPNFNPKLSLGILASGKGSNFEAIINDINNGRLDAEIKCLIVNQPDCGAIDISKKYSIPYKILNHKDYKRRQDLDKDIIEIFNSYKVEGVVMVGWMRIVTKLFLEAFDEKVVNLHPSLLPSFKGNKAIEQTLQNKVKIAGCTVHIVKEEIDSGEILCQAAIPISSDENSLSLLSKIQSQEHRIISSGIAIAAKRWRNG